MPNLPNITYSPGESMPDFYDKIIAAIDAINTLEPIGSVNPYFGLTSPNSTYLLCDGSAISRTTYSGLFALISTGYGVGDGSTTFNLPNLKGKFLVGYDPGDSDYNALTSVKSGGLKEVTLTGAQSGTSAHTHPINRFNPTGATPGQVGYGFDSNTAGNGATELSAEANASSAHENRPPYMTINYLIRVL